MSEMPPGFWPADLDLDRPKRLARFALIDRPIPRIGLGPRSSSRAHILQTAYARSAFPVPGRRATQSESSSRKVDW